MHVVTFYSYKGGVGRTMALVNVAAELARRQRRVLIVDFDLEAPGINTYEFCSGAGEASGVVDYITEYLATSAAPSISKYLHKCAFVSADVTAPVWVMPAGRQNRRYKNAFHSINWEKLYSEQSGFLLMENMKAQWEAEIAPDYVLIDSRTGHTDVSGICTRQLPNAVVFTFFPNKQNLSGLKQIVEEVRAEETGPREKAIHTHFLASNVPDVDDEHQILEKNLSLFEAELDFSSYNTVRHYDNLDLVDQVIFTMGHRKTRLASEYIALADTIIRENPADKEGAISYLKDIQKRHTSVAWRTIKERVGEIEKSHASDPAVLAALATVFDRYDDVSSAISFLEHAIKLEGASTDNYRDLGILYLRSNNQSEATSIFRQIIASDNAASHHVQGALRTLIILKDPDIAKLLALPSVQALGADDKREVLDDLRTRPQLLEFALEFCLRESENSDVPPDDRRWFSGELPLIEIAMGRYESAIGALGSRNAIIKHGDCGPVFNLAMAEWAHTGNVPTDLFSRVLELDDPINLENHTVANYDQCMAVSSWAIGNVEQAKSWIEKARTALNSPGVRDREFSCWRYLRVRRSVFSEDLGAISRLIDGEDLLPEFMTRNAGQLPLA